MRYEIEKSFRLIKDMPNDVRYFSLGLLADALFRYLDREEFRNVRIGGFGEIATAIETMKSYEASENWIANMLLANRVFSSPRYIGRHRQQRTNEAYSPEERERDRRIYEETDIIFLHFYDLLREATCLNENILYLQHAYQRIITEMRYSALIDDERLKITTGYVLSDIHFCIYELEQAREGLLKLLFRFGNEKLVRKSIEYSSEYQTALFQ